MGELLPLRAGEPSLPSDRPPRGLAAASVALSEAQGEDRGDGALLGRETMENLWTHLPCVEAPGLSVGEGMISTESRDAGKPHVRFDERGRGNAARNEIEAPASGESRRQQRLPRSKAGAPPLDSTEERRRATKALRLIATGCQGHERIIDFRLFCSRMIRPAGRGPDLFETNPLRLVAGNRFKVKHE